MTAAGEAQGCRVTVDQTGETFGCGLAESVLDAGLDAGLNLPHSCRGGGCGTCLSLVLDGEVDHGWVQSFAITDEDKARGYCLICQSKPLTPSLRIRPVGDVVPKDAGAAVAPVEIEATVLAGRPLTPSVREIVLAVPAGRRFRFRAGQHVEVQVPGVAPARTYSLADAPGPALEPVDGLLRLYVTRHDRGAASGWLHDHARPGSTLWLKGPYGDFGWQPAAEATEVLLLAGGSGLAPVLALAEHALAADEARPVRLFLSVRDRTEAFGLDRLHALAHRHRTFTWTVALTREAPPPGTGWQHGRIDALLPSLAPAAGFAEAYAAGPPGFVDAVAAALAGLGMPGRLIRTDRFLPKN
jgi:CDP-4-dehydro-6-deoxyglucose reductase, E3